MTYPGLTWDNLK